MYQDPQLTRSPHCPGNHRCHFCGATEDEKLIIKNTHLTEPSDMVDECEDCFCPGCHFKVGCETPSTPDLARRAAAELGDCPAR